VGFLQDFMISHWKSLSSLLTVLAGWLGRHRLGSIWRTLDHWRHQQEYVASLERQVEEKSRELGMAIAARDMTMDALKDMIKAAEYVRQIAATTRSGTLLVTPGTLPDGSTDLVPPTRDALTIP
jgi:hypothetical protein